MALTGTKLLHMRSAVAAAVPTTVQLGDGQIAINTADRLIFIKDSTGVIVAVASAAAVTAAASAVQTVNSKTGPTVVLDSTDIGANGVAPLDVNGKIQLVNVPDALLGGVKFQGTYDASTDTPTLPAPADANKGFYWVVNVAGTQQGLTLNVGDWIISIGTAYDKVDNTDSVTSVNGKQGVVVLTSADVNALDKTLGGTVAGATTFTLELTVPTAVAGTSATNLTQVQTLIAAIPAGVTSVNTKTGAVVLVATDVGALPATAGTVSVATTFTQEVTVPDAVATTSATNLGQVQALISAIPVGGTVTSVAVAVPTYMSSSGGPITDNGTITLAFNTQAANTVFAGPGTGADAAPTFRVLVAADIPALDEGTYA